VNSINESKRTDGRKRIAIAHVQVEISGVFQDSFGNLLRFLGDNGNERNCEAPF